MIKSLKEHVSNSRRLLGNPYAHVEYLEDFGSQTQNDVTGAALDEQIIASRKLLQDPYAYLGDLGTYSAVAHREARSTPEVPANRVPSTAKRAKIISRQHRYTDSEIEARVKKLQVALWNNHKFLCGDIAPADPIEVLDPSMALQFLGYEYSLDEAVGQFSDGTSLIEVAGIIDPSSKTVRVSRQFPLSVRTFTAAHELGHAVLHPTAVGVHRDRPLDGVRKHREPMEIEADKFATLFLMPEKLVRARLLKQFGAERFELDEHTAFALCSMPLDEIQKKLRTARDFSRLLAGAEHYNGSHLASLSTQFHVSIETMAIRLEELSLFDF